MFVPEEEEAQPEEVSISSHSPFSPCLMSVTVVCFYRHAVVVVLWWLVYTQLDVLRMHTGFSDDNNSYYMCPARARCMWLCSFVEQPSCVECTCLSA